MPGITVEVRRILMELEQIERAIALTKDLPDPDMFESKARYLIQLMDARNKGLYEGDVSSTEDDVICAYGRAIELGPNNPEFLLKRGLFYADHGKDDLAITDYLKVKSMPVPKDDICFQRLIETWLTRLQEKLQAKLTPPSIPAPSTAPETEQASSAMASSLSMFSTEKTSVLQQAACSSVTSSPQTMFVAPSVSQSRQKAKIEVLLNRINERTERLQHHPSANGYYQNGDAYMEIAKLSAETGYITKAIENYTIGLTQFPEDLRNFVARATAYMQLGQVYEAVCDIISTRTISVESMLDKQYYFNQTRDIIEAIQKKWKAISSSRCAEDGLGLC